MPATVRDLRPEADLDRLHEIMRTVHPYLVRSRDGLAWQFAHAPAQQRFRVLVGELDRAPVGLVRCGLDWETSVPGQGFAHVSVLPEHRRHGAGTALLAAAEDHLRDLGVRDVHAWGSTDPASERFADRHGYQRRRLARYQRLALPASTPAVPPPPKASTPPAASELPAVSPPTGVALRPWSDFADDPRPLWSADADASRDEPGDVPVDDMPYEGWLASAWQQPDTDRELSIAAVVDGTVAAFTLAQTDPPRYWSGMTGTRRAYRGRGLGTLVKVASLRRAVERGLTEAYTSNDEQNAPMLAINARLGYRESAAQWRCLHHL
jgi:GNAT superfamily N-acetyltransferase